MSGSGMSLLFFVVCWHLATFALSLPLSNVQLDGSKTQYSDTVVTVRNLDWNEPVESVIATLQTQLGGDSSKASIHMKTLPEKRRKRDIGKHHGGSAKITFSTSSHAKDGISALQVYSDREDMELTIGWAPMYSLKRKSTKMAPTPHVLTQDEIDRRKERAASYARRRERIANKTDDILDMIVGASPSSIRESLTGYMPILNAPCLDWSPDSIPEYVDPVRGGKLDGDSARGQRKHAAVEAFWFVLKFVLMEKLDTERSRIVLDLGCGAGNLALPLAFLLGKQGDSLVGVDVNGKSLKRLSERATLSKLDIEVIERDLFDMVGEKSIVDAGPCPDAIVSLHACGVASDLAIQFAVENSVPFAISPCCIGKVKKTWSSGGIKSPSMPKGGVRERIEYPRSSWLKSILEPTLSNDGGQFQMLAAAADYGVIYDSSSSNDDSAELARRKRCQMAKRIVEQDRVLWAHEKGYEIRMLELPRIGALYPKRELLLGAPLGSIVAKRIMDLPTF